VMKGDPSRAACGGDSLHHHKHGRKDEKVLLVQTITAVGFGQFLSLDSTVLDQLLELVEVGQMTWIMKAK